MNDKKLQELKNDYMNTRIPDELEFTVQKALKEGDKMARKQNMGRKWAGAAVASLLLFTSVLNTSPSVAQALSNVPIITKIVDVLTFQEYHVNEENYKANIKVPEVKGLSNQTLENSLNIKYLEENKKLYQDFIKDIEALKSSDSGGHLGVDSGYEIKTDNDQILSIGRWVVKTAGSAAETIKYDTIDKQNEILITLPSLFKDDKYIKVISENIKKQMREQMQTDTGKIYWVSGTGTDEELFTEPFASIARNQNFYINNSGKLVISFDEYEVAPGCMGVVEFTIPSELISEILVSNEYIK
ncbi:MAG: DUF3298 domain-containing protein [Syntrophomonadaceae bacterium]|nr:DUF3298 domain-containing protein [Syntrophomonadaceae bacterium]